MSNDSFMQSGAGAGVVVGAGAVAGAGVVVGAGAGVSAVAGEPASFIAPGYKPENLFKPDKFDFLMAIVTFGLGYMFSRWVLFLWQGWGVSVFTTAYLLFTTAYMIKKGVFKASRAAFFWMGITWLTGLSCGLWGNVGFSATRALFHFCAAVYFILAASGRQIMGKTGNYLLVDGLRTVILIPFRNIINQYVSFSVIGRGGRRGKVLPVLLGVLLAIIIAAFLIPMLEQADSGGFGLILGFFRNIFRFDALEVFFYAFLSIPIAAYIYGLVSGVAFGKGTDDIKPESAEKTVAAMRVFQPATVLTVLGVVCVIYIVFILSQIPYFFSAFTGRRPAGWLIYSEYARRGFFELSGIAMANFAILTVCNVISKKQRIESWILKLFNVVLAAITLVLIATAMSKMALYIGAYGLTMLRLLPCVFMVFMAMVFIAVIVLQKLKFQIVRFALVMGSVVLCLLCLSNPDALVVRYNADRYIGGSLPKFDMEIVRRAGAAGILPAIDVYYETDDPVLRGELAHYLSSEVLWRADYLGISPSAAHGFSLESYIARERLTSIDFETP